jgi:hypothetical protein
MEQDLAVHTCNPSTWWRQNLKFQAGLGHTVRSYLKQTKKPHEGVLFLSWCRDEETQRG